MRSIVVALCGVLLLVGCGTRSKALKVAEGTEAQILSAWREGGLEQKAEDKKGEWKANLEGFRKSDLGPAQTVQNLKNRFKALGSLEEAEAKRLSAQNEMMKAGKPVAENSTEALKLLVGGPRDGKTPEQRAADYAPKIAENARKIEAHKKAAEACLKAVDQFKSME